MLFNSDFETLHKRFENHLGKMLSADELGAFILALANSLQHEHLQTALAPGLLDTFNQLQQRHARNSLQGGADDVQVFAALRETGIQQYRAWQQKSMGPWRAAYNPIRALRPQRASREKFARLERDFDASGFHFDKPFLKAEILDEETFNGHTLRVMYHKFPFISYHLLILLDPREHRPQFMTPWAQQLAWELTERCAARIPGFGLAYNSLGACASVNHLHVHGFVDNEPLSIEQPFWLHNGGKRSYPVLCQPVFSADQCWELIHRLHSENQPYNLLYRPGICYVIPRPPQGQRELPHWMPDAGWYELCGGFNLVRSHHFEAINAADIEAGLSVLKLQV